MKDLLDRPAADFGLWFTLFPLGYFLGNFSQYVLTASSVLAAMSEEVTEMFASLEDPAAFLVHDVRFHRAVAAGCGNRVLAALMEMVAAQFYEIRKETIRHARDLRESAEMHRRIYRAIRAHDPAGARDAMSEHLQAAQHAQTLELRSGAEDGVPAGDHQEE